MYFFFKPEIDDFNNAETIREEKIYESKNYPKFILAY